MFGFGMMYPWYEEYQVFTYKGETYWYQNKKLSRHDGPAVELPGGRKEFWVNGKLHNLNGPARNASSYDEYYVNGELHREDGPAIEYHDEKNKGYDTYFLRGKQLSKEQFDVAIAAQYRDGKVVELDGKKYKLTEIKD